jgi:hypothetical protein
MDLSRLSCLSIPVADAISCLSCHGPVLVALSLLSCSGHRVLCFHSWLYYPNCLVRLSCPVLSQLSCSIGLVPRSTIPSVRSLKSCPAIPSSLPILADLSRVTCQVNPSGLTCLDCPVFSGCPDLTVLPRLSCSRRPASAFFSPALLPRCPVFVVV